MQSYQLSPAVKHRQAIERRIVLAFIKSVMKAGYTVRINNTSKI